MHFEPLQFVEASKYPYFYFFLFKQVQVEILLHI